MWAHRNARTGLLASWPAKGVPRGPNTSKAPLIVPRWGAFGLSNAPPRPHPPQGEPSSEVCRGTAFFQLEWPARVGNRLRRPARGISPAASATGRHAAVSSTGGTRPTRAVAAEGLGPVRTLASSVPACARRSSRMSTTAATVDSTRNGMARKSAALVQSIFRSCSRGIDSSCQLFATSTETARRLRVAPGV